MRTPAQAAVNVIMREDIQKMEDKAKYDGIENQITRLQGTLAQG